MFVNREAELAALSRWWDEASAGLALVWGRRRVGKTALVQRFAADRRAVFHVGAGRPDEQELRVLARLAAPHVQEPRDLERRPFVDWDDALETLGDAARDEPLLLVLDEFPELVASSPSLPGIVRAQWERLRGGSQLRILLCGSAVRTMSALQEQRAPLYGRFDLSLLVHPFRPDEAGRMLPDLAPVDRALVWGLLGGTPLYLSWWNQAEDVAANLSRLVLQPGGRLSTEARLVLATEVEAGDLPARVLAAIAAGRTKHSEVADAVRADPTRTLERLVELRLVERLVPVTEDPRRTRRRLYRIADPFLSFALGVLDPYRGEIERGLGPSVLPVLMQRLDAHLGRWWEEAFCAHLRRLAVEGQLGEEVVAIGPWWRDGPEPVELDAVVLAGVGRRPILVGEAKWARRVDGRRLARDLARRAAAVSDASHDIRLALAARERIDDAPPGVLTLTAADVFGPALPAGDGRHEDAGAR